MKKIKLFTLLCSVSLVLILVACTAPAPAPAPTPPKEVIKLSSATYFPPVHQLAILQDEWGKEIEERTSGRVEIVFHPGGSLLGPANAYDGVTQGIADIATSHVGYTRGRFPVTEILTLPLAYNSAWVATHVVRDFRDEYKLEEWDDVHILLWHCGVAKELELAKKPVRKLEDLEGLTIRAPGVSADVAAALGATPREVPMPEVYEALSKGIVDGFLGSAEVLKGWKFAEVCDYVTFIPGIGHAYVFYMVMNKDKWNSLPEDVKQIVNEVSGEYEAKYALAENELVIEGVEYAKNLGVEVIKLAPQEAARCKAAIQPVIDKYVEQMRAKGYSEAKTREQIAFLKERIEYWIRKQAEMGIPSALEQIE